MRGSLTALALVVFMACSGTATRVAPRIGPPVTPQRVTEHRDGDDLLTAGLGLEGLRAPTAPAIADAANPTPAELRRRAIWSSWRGIADLTPGGGYGEVYGSVASVPGRELSAFMTAPGASQPHRVLVQVPDTFDTTRPCLAVAPSSGSRGVYGAIAVAAPFAFAHKCAVAYTDKGAGSDYFDLDSDTGVRLDGTRGPRGEALAFTPEATGHGVAVKHAHSRDNPEAQWGTHVLQAAEFGLSALRAAYPKGPAFDFASTRVIAVGISNGGGSVLRAAEASGEWLDGVVAGEPNVFGDGGKALYDYATQAALLMPCALMHYPAKAIPRGPFEAAWSARCKSLAEAGLVSGDKLSAQADAAYETLKASGFTDAAMMAGATVTAFDLWRSVVVTYASAYSRAGATEMPCGYAFAVIEDGKPRAAIAGERAVWSSDAAGIPPGSGVAIVDTKAAGADPSFPGLMCLRELMNAPAVAENVTATHAWQPKAGLPIVIVHGVADGLIPEAFSSMPYVKAAKAQGRVVTQWRIENAQHFDAFMALPGYSARYLPLLPHVYEALEQLWTHLDGTAPMPADKLVAGKPASADGT